jgi:hypothetical protein
MDSTVSPFASKAGVTAAPTEPQRLLPLPTPASMRTAAGVHGGRQPSSGSMSAARQAAQAAAEAAAAEINPPEPSQVRPTIINSPTMP